MNISGLVKFSLLDYPGKIACVIFTQGCNFRCPFCHNPDLIELKEKVFKIQQEKVWEFLLSRKNKLEGVVITGGEPTLQPDLIEFLKKLKQLNFAIKLDSNGSNPNKLALILEQKLVDFVAMDIKNTPSKYAQTCGKLDLDLRKIQKSVHLIKNSGIDYEFRTTVVPSLHTQADILEIGHWLNGSSSYALQTFRNDVVLDANLKNKSTELNFDLHQTAKLLQSNFNQVVVRG